MRRPHVDDVGYYVTASMLFLMSGGLDDGPRRLGAYLAQRACNNDSQHRRRGHVYGVSQAEMCQDLEICPSTLSEWFKQLYAYGLVVNVVSGKRERAVYALYPRHVPKGEAPRDPTYVKRKQPPRQPRNSGVHHDRGVTRNCDVTESRNCEAALLRNCEAPLPRNCGDNSGSDHSEPILTSGTGDGVELRSAEETAPEAPAVTTWAAIEAESERDPSDARAFVWDLSAASFVWDLIGALELRGVDASRQRKAELLLRLGNETRQACGRPFARAAYERGGIELLRAWAKGRERQLEQLLRMEAGASTTPRPTRPPRPPAPPPIVDDGPAPSVMALWEQQKAAEARGEAA